MWDQVGPVSCPLATRRTNRARLANELLVRLLLAYLLPSFSSGSSLLALKAALTTSFSGMRH